MIKDSAAVLDYGYNWALWLGTDTIVTSTWVVETGLTKGADTHDTTTTTVWLSGGTVGESYLVTNHIVTTGGRTDERTFSVSVRNR